MQFLTERATFLLTLLGLTLANPAAAQVTSIWGTVTDATPAHVPLAHVLVEAFDARTPIDPITTTITREDGSFELLLAPGTYKLRTENSGLYVDQAYEGLPCGRNCSLVTAAPVTVVAGETAALEPIRLDMSATITGTVRRDPDRQPLGGIVVSVHDERGDVVASTTTIAADVGDGSSQAGSYVLARLPPGTYFVRAVGGATNYVPAVFDGGACVGACRGGTPVVLAPGETRDRIDFGLRLGGGVTGALRRADGDGGPLDRALVHVFDTSGTWIASANPSRERDGAFRISGLPAGRYYVTSENGDGFVDEVYAGAGVHVECTRCDPPRTPGAAAVTVIEDETRVTSHVDLTLAPRSQPVLTGLAAADAAIGGRATAKASTPGAALSPTASEPSPAAAPDTDNVEDSGSPANRWRSGYFGTSIRVGPDTLATASTPMIDLGQNWNNAGAL